MSTLTISGDPSHHHVADTIDGALINNNASFVINGLDGNDRLFGGSQADTLNGGDDNDLLVGREGNDTLNGDAGDDRLQGGIGADVLNGGAGTDTAQYNDAASGVTLSLLTGVGTGGEANGDTFVSIENVTGSAFNDQISGDDKANLLTGNGGDDHLFGNGGDDHLVTGSGNDVLDGGTGNDTLEGGGGDDVLKGGAGADDLDGGLGRDVASYAGATSGVTLSLATGGTGGDAAGDTFHNIEDVIGTSFADHITGDAGDNKLSGGAGDDFLRGGLGSDILDGGSGNDTADYGGFDLFAPSRGVGVTLSLATGGTAGEAAGDSFISIENVIGTKFADHITGNDVANLLSGAGGNDILDGGKGNDTLVGGKGADELTGGDGADIFKFAAGDSTSSLGGSDLIHDFKIAQGDKIDLSGIDANVSAAGHQDFHLVEPGTPAAAGELSFRFDQDSNTTIVSGHTDGDGIPDFQVRLEGHIDLHANNFIGAA